MAEGGSPWTIDEERAGPRAAPDLEVVVHNASTLGPLPLRGLVDLAGEDLERVFQVNVLGPARLTRALLPGMLLRGRGVVATLSSDAAVEAYPTWGAYGASKAALDHWTRTLAAELEGTGVRAEAYDPGEMDTRMHADALPDADPATLRRPEAVARALAARLLEPQAAVRTAITEQELGRGEEVRHDPGARAA